MTGNPASGGFSLTGPCAKPDPRAVPVRGDLAHIRMAGKVFVPHYAVPMPHRALAGATVLCAPHGEVIAELAAGAEFHVLDMAGGYAWGEVPGGEVPGDGIPGGTIGYVPLDKLETGQ